MKKRLLSMITSSLLFGGTVLLADSKTDMANVEKLNKIFKNYNIEVKNILEKMETPIENIEVLIVKDTKGKVLPIYSTTDMKYVLKFDPIVAETGLVLPEGFSDKLKSYQNSEKNIKDGKILEVVEKELKDFVIKIDRKKDKDLYVFSDPLCPYCQKEIRDANFQRFSQDYNIHFVMLPLVSLHGQEAINISEVIFDKVAKVKNEEEKMEVLKKYIKQGIKLTTEETKSVQDRLTVKYSARTRIGQVDFNVTPAMNKTLESLLNSGLVQGTPYKFIKQETISK